MLVYGDRHERADPRAHASVIDRTLESVEQMPAGIARHSSLVAAFVETGRLLQGIADHAFAPFRCDRSIPGIAEVSGWLLNFARAVCTSWDSGFADIAPLARLQADHAWPLEVQLRVPEGFAFYALYPEAYLEAARRLKLSGAPVVIGIRSIGTSLGAIVAAALGTSRFMTVRPFGDPFAREIAIDPALERELLDGNAHYVVVDEGPGQSGSSFAAVANWLRQRGVADKRIAIVSSHAGPPGSAASEKGRRWWGEVQREVGDFGYRWPELIERWCAHVVGELDEPAHDISGGAWRRLHYASEDDWPAVVAAWERRKFLLRARGERFLVKFTGIGRIGEEKLALARLLHSEGMTPEPVGLIHGFIVERWCANAAPLRDGDVSAREIARYIAARAKMLAAPSDSGASPAELSRMIRRNISLEFGDEAAQWFDFWQARSSQLDRRIVRVRTDNKLDRDEWLRSESREPIKTDALDHHQGHDLIGCQDVAWDVAGAIVEFDLDQQQSRVLIEDIEDSGVRVDRELLSFYRLAYLAFRLGQFRLGESMSGAAEQRRLRERADACAAKLQLLLEPTRSATRPESLVD
jgi:hypothetical protein